MIRFALAFVAAFCLCAAAVACPPPQPERIPMQSTEVQYYGPQQTACGGGQVQPVPYAAVPGQVQPIFATPVRTAIWRSVQPRAYYVRPVAPVPAAPVPRACPHCRRY